MPTHHAALHAHLASACARARAHTGRPAATRTRPPRRRGATSAAVMQVDATSAEQASGSGLYFCECKLRLFISPAYLNDPMAGVHDQLSRMLLKYSPPLSGVPLAFSEVVLVSRQGIIRQDEPH
eukprot:64238-Prymnesium_polylepis.1